MASVKRALDYHLQKNYDSEHKPYEKVDVPLHLRGQDEEYDDSSSEQKQHPDEDEYEDSPGDEEDDEEYDDEYDDEYDESEEVPEDMKEMDEGPPPADAAGEMPVEGQPG